MTFRMVPGDAGGLVVREWGVQDADRPPALFLHPLNLQGLVWQRLVQELDPSRRYIALDLRGHGTSTPQGPFGLEYWARDCLAVLDASGISRAHLVGGSMGGVLAPYIASIAPVRVISTTSMGSGFPPADDAAGLARLWDLETLEKQGARAWFREIVPGISLAPAAPDELVHLTLLLSNANSPEVIAEIMASRAADDGRSVIEANPSRSALVVAGDQDPAYLNGRVSALAEVLGTPVEVIAGSGHLPMLETPSALGALIESHLRRSEEISWTEAAGE
jgi:pimeloyl-ACP methyl ester carboxylesterase